MSTPLMVCSYVLFVGVGEKKEGGGVIGNDLFKSVCECVGVSVSSACGWVLGVCL